MTTFVSLLMVRTQRPTFRQVDRKVLEEAFVRFGELKTAPGPPWDQWFLCSSFRLRWWFGLRWAGKSAALYICYVGSKKSKLWTISSPSGVFSCTMRSLVAWGSAIGVLHRPFTAEVEIPLDLKTGKSWGSERSSNINHDFIAGFA